MKWLIAGIAGFVGVVVIGAAVLVAMTAGGSEAESRADVGGQGGEGEPIAADGAVLIRSADGIRVGTEVPTPMPSSYEYPKGDMVPGWASPHPEVVRGQEDDHEVFTLWLFAFNYPDLCTDEACDLDDLAPDAAAKGGSYQADGRIADTDELDLAASIRLGQPPANGAALENPLGAEVHLVIAPHGKALTGADLYRQLNGPIGNPTLWWAATFAPLESADS